MLLVIVLGEGALVQGQPGTATHNVTSDMIRRLRQRLHGEAAVGDVRHPEGRCESGGTSRS